MHRTYFCLCLLPPSLHPSLLPILPSFFPLSLLFSLSLCLSVSLSVCVSVFQSVCLSVSLFLTFSIWHWQQIPLCFTLIVLPERFLSFEVLTIPEDHGPSPHCWTSGDCFCLYEPLTLWILSAMVPKWMLSAMVPKSQNRHTTGSGLQVAYFCLSEV